MLLIFRLDFVTNFVNLVVMLLYMFSLMLVGAIIFSNICSVLQGIIFLHLHTPTSLYFISLLTVHSN